MLSFFASCEDVLDKKELDAIDDTDLWNNASLATFYLNNLYSMSLPGFGGAANSGLSDEGMGTGAGNMMYGMLTVSDGVGNYGVGNYRVINRINLLVTEIDKGNIPQAERDPIKGQALFLRAWNYWEMVKLHGGVPMVMEMQDVNAGEGLYRERDPASRCIELIVRDLDEAIAKLPVTWPSNSYGRITKAAAAALKGRVLLYYASPQFNPNDLPERWAAAYDANVQAKQLAQAAGHALHSNYERIFLDEANKEAIFVRVFDKTQQYHGYENSVRPASVKNSGGANANPTWEMVQAYPMADGHSIEGHPGYDQTFFWKGRDPRFYATIVWNSAVYQMPGDRFYENTSKTRRQWTYLNNDQEANQNTPTGFYLRKNVDASIPKTETIRTPTDWIEIRYAEVLLNLAEAANEVGKVDEAYAELKAIRQRAGIQAGGDGNYGLAAGMIKETMREAVMLERQLELAYENKRHWDLRRRNLFAQKLNGTRRTGIQAELNTDYIASVANVPAVQAKAVFESSMRDTINWDKDYNKYFITNYNVLLDEREINYLQPLYNFYFIPQTNLDKDPKIKQTIGWTTGGDGFDPLAP